MVGLTMSVPCDMLLHPELLTNEQIIYIIHERHLRVSNLERLPRDELLDIFHNYCVPYGQRKYRDSGRGKVLNKNRAPSPESAKKSTVVNNTTMKFNKANPNCERLKPPPELSLEHNKRIKLETMTPLANTDRNINNNTNVNKRKMVVGSTTLTRDCPPPKKERKPITWP